MNSHLEQSLSYIEALQNDWDGEGATRYPKELIEKTRKYAEYFLGLRDFEDFTKFDINPAGNTLDIFVGKGPKSLLINIFSGGAAYYGDNTDDKMDTISGHWEIPEESNQEFEWLFKEKDPSLKVIVNRS